MSDHLAVKSDASTTLGTLATDECLIGASTVHVCRNKLGFGGDGTYTEVATGVGLPVEVSAALPAGDNNIGNVDVASLPALPAGTNNIGDVDVLSVVPGTGATSLGKAADAVAGATDTGIAPLAIRDDALAAITPAEGDYAQLRVDANGALWVTLSGSITVGSHHVTNAGTFAVQVNGDALTSLQLLDNLVLAEDAPHSSGDPGVQLLAVRQDAAAALAGTSGDYIPLIVDGSGRLHVAVGNTITVNAHDVTQSGVWNIATVTTVTTVATVSTLTGGGVAHDSADSGNPVKVGARAISAEIAAVAAGDRVDLLADLVGRLLVRPHCNPEQQLDGVGSKTDTTDAAVIAAQGAGVRIYVSDVALANSSASNVIVELKSGSTVRFRFPVPAGGGCVKHFDPPLRLTANEALNFASLTAASTVYFSASGFKGV